MRKMMFLGVAAMAVHLSGCGDAATAAPGAPDAGREVAATSYEIVTETRPESVEAQITPERVRYKQCAALAEQMSLPVQPFPEVPQGYFTERNTWASDGKVYLVRNESYGLDTSSLTPEKGCSTRFSIASSTQVHRGKKVRLVEVWYDGERSESNEEGNAPTGPRARELAAYTVTKTVRGYPVRCLPPGSPGLTSRMPERCVADGGSALPASYSGSPIVVHLRMKNAQATTDLVMEPKTIRIGGRIDQGALRDAGAL